MTCSGLWAALTLIAVAIAPFRASLKEVPLSEHRRTVSFAVVGDIMVHDNQLEAALASDGTCCFDGWFRLIQPYLEGADIIAGNLETVLVEEPKRYAGFPMFGAPTALADALKQTGFNLLFTSNNHALDKGLTGVSQTLDALDRNEIAHAGTYRGPDERDRVLTIRCRDVAVAILAYTEHVNGLESTVPPETLTYTIARIDMAKIDRDIRCARTRGADAIVVYLHWGPEYLDAPLAYQKRLAQKIIDSGADVLIASHPHVVQPVAWLERAVDHEPGLVAYSLGNFVSDQRSGRKAAGGILRFSIEKPLTPEERVRVHSVRFHPTWVDRGRIDDRYSYRILPMPEAMSEHEAGIHPAVDSLDAARMKTQFAYLRDKCIDPEFLETVPLHDFVAQWADAIASRPQPGNARFGNLWPHAWSGMKRQMHSPSREARDTHFEGGPEQSAHGIPDYAIAVSLRLVDSARTFLEPAAAALRPVDLELLDRYDWSNRVRGAVAAWVSVDEQVLRVVRNGEVLWSGPCSTAAAGTGIGRNSSKTPTGWHVVKAKYGDGLPCGAVVQDNAAPRESWAIRQGVADSLALSRVLALYGIEPGRNQGGETDSFARGIAIHGTTAESALGTPASRGCVRLSRRDVVTVFDLLNEGAPVLITEVLPKGN